MQIVINTRGTRLHKVGKRLLIQAGEKKLALSAPEIQSIMLAAAATISTDAIGLTVAANIDIIFLDKSGFLAKNGDSSELLEICPGKE